MLPSMPILFTRDSQDAFGNKIEPSTSFFNQNSISKTAIKTEPTIKEPEQGPSKIHKEVKINVNTRKKDESPKPTSNINALEAALVKSYYTKVQSRFASNSSLPTNKFVQFREILKTFDPAKGTPVDLYNKVEKLFGEEHKDIVEEFLLFLKPGQAATVGRFMDHFMQTQITSFIELLNKTFNRKPTVLRKVLRAITTGINSGSSEEMKNRVLPHLRSNARLTKLFKLLFPEERPLDSLYDTGTDVINEDFLNFDNGYDVWEFEDNCAEQTDKRKINVKEGLDTVYLQGRVFLQHGRMLRTACVTYPYSKEPYRVHARRLAPDHCHLSPPASDEERSSPKRTAKNTCKIPPPKRTKKQLKSPTKQVKDVNDNTKHKDCLTQTLSNVKTVKSKAHTKSRSSKDRKEEPKTEGTKNKKIQDNKVMICLKKDEGIKTKQFTTEKVKIESSKLEIKTWTTEEEKSMLKTEVETKTKQTALERDTIQAPQIEMKSWTREEDKAMLQVFKRENETKIKQATLEKVKIESPKLETKSWTREEDKTMLQVLKGEAGSEQVLGRISEMLPHRSALEIRERFCYVMKYVLQQMAVSEVT